MRNIFRRKFKPPSALVVNPEGKQSFLEKHIGMLGSISSIVALLLSTVPTVLILSQSSDLTDDRSLLIIGLFVTVIALVVTFLIFNFYYAQRITIAVEKTARADELMSQRQRSEILIRSGNKVVHNILHYYRYVLIQLSQANKLFIKDFNALGEAEQKSKLRDFREILDDFSRFMEYFLNNIKFYTDSMVEDDTAVCIKILKVVGGEPMVKTFYRDEMSGRERGENDIEDKKPKIYSVKKNTAFKDIVDPEKKSNKYFENDLLRKHDERDYYNSNDKWMTQYQSCAVVPISIVPKLAKTEGQNRIVLGFLCVDKNSKGHFSTTPLEDFLSGFGDLLANLFLEFNQFADHMGKRGVLDHAAVRRFNDWDGS